MNNTLLATVPFHQGDVTQTLKLLDWIRELDGGPVHGTILLVADAATDKKDIQAVKEKAASAFIRSEAMGIHVGARKGVDASNFMFQFTAATVKERFKAPWLWMEPDCIPTRTDWLHKLSLGYAHSTKRYLGAMVQGNDPMLPKEHLAGCAVYPPDAYEDLQKVMNERKRAVIGPRAWDIEMAAVVAPASQPTDLIQHFWGPSKDISPIFVRTKKADAPVNHVTLDFVNENALLFHRNKDGSLIDVLRKSSAPEPVAEQRIVVPKSQKKSKVATVEEPVAA